MEKDEIREAVGNGTNKETKLPDEECNVAIYRRKAASYDGVRMDLNDDKMHEILTQHPLWKYMGVYEDNGKSCEALDRLMSDCREGKVNLILAQSMSGFSLYLNDTINQIRKLKDLGVGVYFLEEGYYTLDKAFDFIISLFITLAEEESRMKSMRLADKNGIRFKEIQTEMI